jgi:nucleoside-diphosphate-sugar epimerase
MHHSWMGGWKQLLSRLGSAALKRLLSCADWRLQAATRSAATLAAAMRGARRARTSDVIVCSDPVVTGQYRLGDVRHITADSARLREELQWRPRVDFATGMAELAGAGKNNDPEPT